MNAHPFLVRLLKGQGLTMAQSRQIFVRAFCGELTRQETKNLLLLLARKKESPDELAGCVQALRLLEPPVRAPISKAVMDVCGTGGDGSHSFNISTLSSFVIAGAGGKVSKHGNRSITSCCGSSDLIEAMGIYLDAGRHRMLESLRRYGLGYFHAPFYHPVFSRMQPLRKELKRRTIFNLLGPLSNPVQLDCQMIGVSKPEYVPLFARTLARFKTTAALICYGTDGMDEISIGAPTRLAWVKGSEIAYKTFRPEQYGLRIRNAKSRLMSRGVRNSTHCAIRLLKGKLRGPLHDTVVLNSAAALLVSGNAKDFQHGIKMAKESLDSGSAYRVFLGLKKISRRKKIHGGRFS